MGFSKHVKPATAMPELDPTLQPGFSPHLSAAASHCLEKRRHGRTPLLGTKLGLVRRLSRGLRVKRSQTSAGLNLGDLNNASLIQPVLGCSGSGALVLLVALAAFCLLQCPGSTSGLALPVAGVSEVVHGGCSFGLSRQGLEALRGCFTLGPLAASFLQPRLLRSGAPAAPDAEPRNAFVSPSSSQNLRGEAPLSDAGTSLWPSSRSHHNSAEPALRSLRT